MSVRAGRGVLDTSTLIELERITDSSVLPVEALITALTLAELSGGVEGERVEPGFGLLKTQL